jgi:hypothetical protein
VKSRCRFSRLDCDRRARINRAAIEARLHSHHADAGFKVASQNRMLNWGGTAPTRQQRCMQIDTRGARPREHPTWQQKAEGDDDDQVRRISEAREKVGVAQIRRLRDSQAERLRSLFDGRLGRPSAPARRPIRLRQDETDFRPIGM